MTNTNTTAAAKTLSDYQLAHVARVLEAELLATMQATGRGTTADLGRLEMLAAASDELCARGYAYSGGAWRKRDGSDLPHDVAMEYAYGCSVRLSTPVRCF